MSSTTAPTIPLATTRPAEPPKPAPSRTPYRPAADTSFSAALRAAANEAMLAQFANPSAARIGAPTGAIPPGQPGTIVPGVSVPGVSVPGVGLPVGAMPGAVVPGAVMPGVTIPGVGMPGVEVPAVGVQAPAGVDARLWESLARGVPLQMAAVSPAVPVAPDALTMMAGRVEHREPAVQAVTPAMIREQGQAFLKSIKGFDQTSASEYESAAQARAWGYSTCSAAALTAVLRAAGHDVKIADVMKAMPGGMTIQLGLVSRPSLVNAANQFGAVATDDIRSYEALKEATDNGQPVLVDIRNGKFPEGHWIVVTGVDDNGVRCADSSRYDLTSIPRGEFLGSWSSRGIRLDGLTPTPSPTTGPAAAPARANVRSA